MSRGAENRELPRLGGLARVSTPLRFASWLALLGLASGCREDRAGPPSPPAARADGGQARRAPPRDPPAHSLPACAQELRSALRDTLRAAPRPRSEAYLPPAPRSRARLQGAIRAALGSASGEAQRLAAAAGYRLCQAGEVVLLWGSAGHALVALRRGPARPVLVSVPHPLFEPKTATQGRLGFDRWRARALVVAGAHRCASSQASGCPGRSRVCGLGLRAFTRSDAGHAADAQFQAAHEALLGLEPGLTVVSLHGMAEQGISLSDGARGRVAADSLLARAARALTAAFPGARVTACQEGAGVPHAERLCGRTNLQGRLVNGAASPCGAGPSLTRGRFLHLEQSEAVRARPARLVDTLAPLLP